MVSWSTNQRANPWQQWLVGSHPDPLPALLRHGHGFDLEDRLFRDPWALAGPCEVCAAADIERKDPGRCDDLGLSTLFAQFPYDRS